MTEKRGGILTHEGQLEDSGVECPPRHSFDRDEVSAAKENNESAPFASVADGRLRSEMDREKLLGGEDHPVGQRPPLPATRLVLVFIGIIAFANVIFGFENSVVSGAKDDFAAEYGLSTTSASYGFLAGAMPIGATFAALFAGFLQDGVGRRITLCLCCLVYIASAFVSYSASGFAMLAAGRVLTGVSIGVFSSTVPMFIAELSPSHLRGTLVTCNQVSICTGILLGYATCKALKPHWRLQFIAGAPVAALLLLAFIFITPYSPRWLMSKGREEEARAILACIRSGGQEAVDEEVTLIKTNLAAARSGRPWDKMREPHVLWAVAIGVMAATMQQWCGVNAVNAFAQQIFVAAGFSASQAATEAIYIGVAKLVFVIVALMLMDVLGRKVLLLVGAAGMTATLLSLGYLLTHLGDPVSPATGIGAAASLVLYMAFFEISLGPVLWLLLSELYPLQVKGVAMGIGATTCWLFTYAVTQVYPFMVSGLGVGPTFYFFAAMCAFSFVWIFVFLPETKGRSLEEIEDDLRASCGLPSAVEATAGAKGGKAAEGKGLFVTLSALITKPSSEDERGQL